MEEKIERHEKKTNLIIYGVKENEIKDEKKMKNSWQ